MDAGTGRGPGHCPLSMGRQLLPISFPSGLLLRLQNIPERGRGPGPLSPGQLRLGPGSQERRSQPAQGVTGQPLPVTRQAGVWGQEEVAAAAAPPEEAPRGRSPHIHHRVPGNGPCRVSRPLSGGGLSGAPCPPGGRAGPGSTSGCSEVTAAAQPVSPVPPSCPAELCRETTDTYRQCQRSRRARFSSSKPVCVMSRDSIYLLSACSIPLHVLIHQRSHQTLEIETANGEVSVVAKVM